MSKPHFNVAQSYARIAILNQDPKMWAVAIELLREAYDC